MICPVSPSLATEWGLALPPALFKCAAPPHSAQDLFLADAAYVLGEVLGPLGLLLSASILRVGDWGRMVEGPGHRRRTDRSS